MSWFGWLTKGKCEVSVLDGLTFFMELGLAVILFIVVAYIASKFKK